MTEPIRVLHFADTHVGVENYGRLDSSTGLNTRLMDFVHRIDEMIAIVRERGVDLVIFAGDAFKTRTPSPTHQREFAFRIRDLAELAPVVLLEGNHDLPQMDRKASSIEIYDTLAVPNVFLANAYTSMVVETRRGPVYVACAPYPIRQRLLRDFDTSGKTITEIDRMVASELDARLAEFAFEAAEQDMPRLLTGHFTISGATFGSERSIMLGRDVEAPLSTLAASCWDYVAMGHIHKHQNVADKTKGAPPVVYSGSLERIDFGEERDAKGFCLVELARGQTTWQFVPVQARPFVTIRLDLREDETPTETLCARIEAADLSEAVVRVLVELSPESQSRFDSDRVRDALKRQGVSFIAGVQEQVDHPHRSRLGASAESLSDIELLERFLIDRQAPPERRERLMLLAEPILSGGLPDMQYDS